MPALSLAFRCHHPIDERPQIRRHGGFIELDRVLMRITFHAQFVLKPVCAGMLRSQYRRKFKQMRLLNEIVQLRLLFRRQSGGVDVMDQSQSRKSPAPLQVNLHTCFSKRSEEHTSELQSLTNLVCRLL